MVEFGHGFGSFGDLHRRAPIRMPANPMDKCTIVSVYPNRIVEIKHTTFPGVFVIDPAPDNDFTILVVGASSWYKEMPDGQPFLEIPDGSILMAQSIINDWCNGLAGVNMPEAMPGLFFVPGVLTKAEILKNHKDKLDLARTRQNAYWESVIQLADVMWARTSGNPLSISNEARIGAVKLGRKDKPWLQDFYASDKKACQACGQFINPNFPICQYCHHIVNQAKYDELKLKKAE